MSVSYLLSAIVVMAAVTHLPRILPLVVFRKKIKSEFIQSFLTYMPYGVLSAMIFPAVLNSTEGLVSAVCGLAVALIMSWRGFGLLPVSIGAVTSVFAAEQIMQYIF